MSRHLRAGIGAAVNLEVVLHDLRTGRSHLWLRTHNLVTAAGLNLIRDSLRGTSPDPLSHFAVGTGAAAVVSGDTALGTEVFRDVFTQLVPTAAQLLIRYFLGPADANGHTLSEAGLLNAASGGDLYARVILLNPIVKTNAIATTFNWTLTWENA